MPIFVGSNSDDSRIRSNRVGFAVSTANPGSASEGDVYFNSSDGGLRAYDGSNWSAVGAGGGTLSGIASGSLSNGQTVIIQSDGTVAGVTTTQITQTLGDISTYSPTSVESENFEGVYHSGVEKMVIAYKKNPDQHGYAVVGKISDTTISYSTTATEFYDNTMEYPTIVYDSNSDRIVIAFQDHQNYARAIVGTVNANDTITFGTSVKFNTVDPDTSITGRYFSGVFDSTNNKVVFAFQNMSNSDRGNAIVGTVDPSDNSITFGSPTTFETGITYNIAATYDSTNSRVVIAYRDSNHSHRGKAIVGAVSGTSISFGGEQTFETGGGYEMGIAYDSDNSKVIISYRDSGDSNKGKAVVGTVDPSSNYISYGSIVTFSDSCGSSSHVAYDEAAQKVVITFRDCGESHYGKYQLGTISGTSISFDYAVDSAPTFNAYTTWNPTVVYDPSSKRNLIIYNDTNNSDYQTTRILRNAFVDTNLTSSNFLGFSDAGYTNGQTATIQIAGAVDDAQSGLTTGSLHYVQTNGTLSTTADTPSVEAGTALSATKIKIKK